MHHDGCKNHNYVLNKKRYDDETLPPRGLEIEVKYFLLQMLDRQGGPAVNCIEHRVISNLSNDFPNILGIRGTRRRKRATYLVDRWKRTTTNEFADIRKKLMLRVASISPSLLIQLPPLSLENSSGSNEARTEKVESSNLLRKTPPTIPNIPLEPPATPRSVVRPKPSLVSPPTQIRRVAALRLPTTMAPNFGMGSPVRMFRNAKSTKKGQFYPCWLPVAGLLSLLVPQPCLCLPQILKRSMALTWTMKRPMEISLLASVPKRILAR